MSDKKFIQKAIKKPGALRKSLGVKKGEKIPASKLKAAAKKKGKMGQRARLAITLGKLRKKRTKKQLKDSRDESYGRFGSAAKKSGKINR